MLTTKRGVLMWVRRKAAEDGVETHHFVVQDDGFVYAMPAPPKVDALDWWQLPYLGPEGEQDFIDGTLCGTLEEP